MLVQIGVGLLVAIATAWVLFAAVLWRATRKNQIPLAVAARILPDTLRLLHRLLKDRSLPNAIRWRLGFAVVYCGQPFNLIPDFIPVIGFADNAVVAAWALRSTVRLSGPDTIKDHWPGNPAGLDLLYRALRVAPPQGRGEQATSTEQDGSHGSEIAPPTDQYPETA